MSFPLTRLTLACLTGLSFSTHASELRLDDSVVTARGYVSDSFATPQAKGVNVDVTGSSAASTTRFFYSVK